MHNFFFRDETTFFRLAYPNMERKHATRFAGQISVAAAINASVVQGSGVGPAEYDVNASDLHPINTENYFFNFADDTYLIVGARMRSTL